MAETFRRKSVEVQAIQWTGDNHSDVDAFCVTRFSPVDPEDRPYTDDPEATASLLTDPHSTWELVYTGDWIVRDDQGRYTRWRDADFRETYEQVR